MVQNIFIRDTLILADVFNSLSAEKQTKINGLISEYNQIGYIDARTQIGPDQAARMSKKQHEKISSSACKVFAIEDQIKEFLKSDTQLKNEAEKQAAIDLQKTIDRIKYRIRDIENFLQRKLNSNRENPTKKEYRELKEQLIKLTA